MEFPMAGRKPSAVALIGSIALFAISVGCRDQALTPPGTVSNAAFASNIVLVGGDGQTGTAATTLPESISVRVIDAGGTPVVGATVVWTIRLGGGTTSPPTATSDANGIASAAWTLGTTPGPNAIRAYLTNGYVLDSLNFTATGG